MDGWDLPEDQPVFVWKCLIPKGESIVEEKGGFGLIHLL